MFIHLVYIVDQARQDDDGYWWGKTIGLQYVSPSDSSQKGINEKANDG